MPRIRLLFCLSKRKPCKIEKRIGNQEIITIVPLHKELAPGTIKGVLDLAGIDEKDFWKKV